MKVIKFLLGLVAVVGLLGGGFTAGSFIAQSGLVTPQPTYAQGQVFQPQPTAIWPQQMQPTSAPQQLQGTPTPQTAPPAIPPQGQWEPGWWMMDANYVPQGEWEPGWMMNPNGQQGWGMHDWDGNHWEGMHGGMMNGYGWQTNPNANPTPMIPNNSPTYPTPSAPLSFKDNIQPIFAARCVVCHGGTNGLFLDTYENVLKGGVNGAVVIPGDVYSSRLAYYVYTGYMPFRNSPLTAVEVQTVLDWIAAGAPNN